MKRIVITLLLVFCASFIFAQETVIGSVYLKVDAGERYELYQSSANSFRAALKGWEYVESKDKTVRYSYDELYAKLKEEALRKYGSLYPDLDLKDFKYKSEYTDLPDKENYSQVCGSSTKYKRTEREAKYYECSATVVVRGNNSLTR